MFYTLKLTGGSWYIVSMFYVILGSHALHIRPNIKGSSITELSIVPTANGVEIELLRDRVMKLKGTIGVGLDFSERIPYNYSLNIYDEGDAYIIEWETNDTSNTIQDCYDLEKGTINWYGGPQIYQQEWPIEKLNLSGNDAYVVRKDANFAVPERYWLNSRGAYIFVSERVPLYVDQNMMEDGKVCFIAKNSGPYINRKSVFHSYVIAALDDAVAAHRHAIGYLGRPSAIPNKKLIKEPIWTTWAKYKKDITDGMVRDFAYDILNHGFKGQIEIDEKWETCFGSRVFMPDKFGNISNVVEDLKTKNLRVTLWAAPFVNPDCEDLVKEGEEKGYYVKNINGNMSTVWWESTNAEARQIDFTEAEARKWYSEKLRRLLADPGVDSFKFDAGETDYVAQPAVYENEDPELVPNIFTQRYINTIAQFGDLIEARSAFRTQNYSFFLRMIDKDSVWGLDDGLQSLVTTLLQLNMVGYSFVLPDMIGGNGYRAQPDLELLIRWTQATVFMPSMQFSYLPWDFANDNELNGTEIIRSMIRLHGDYYEFIEEAMTATINERTPTNPPIWWIDPTDKIALQTSDEYLLGESILVAPVMEKGATSRTIYLPKGTWKDGNNSTNIYTGPLSFTYNAPISILPFFIKQ